jgi:hypothetical protein
MDADSTAEATAKTRKLSERRLHAFAFKVLLLIPISVAFAASRNVPAFNAAAFFCGWYSSFAGLAAAVQRHRLNAAYLTAWDEMAAFMGLAAIARLIGSIVG